MNPPRPRRLVSTCSILVDLVLDLPALPDRGGDVLAEQALFAAGGGMNVLASASRLGLTTAYAGPHGTGPFGDRVRQALAHDDVVALLPVDPGQDTGYCITLVEPDGERTFVTVTGADGHADAAALGALVLQPDDAVFVSGYDLAYPGSGPVVADWSSRLPTGALLVVDPGPLVADIDPALWRRVLPRTDVLTLNDREAEQLPALAPWLPEHAVVVHRVGPDGARLQCPGSAPALVAAPAVPAVDTTGAGDTHVGAMLAALGHGLGWERAVSVANHAAAFSVTVRGGVAGPTLTQLAELMGCEPFPA